KALRPLLEPLHEWITVDSPKPPPIVLNKHCPLCPFQGLCLAQAEQEDNLSLLDGVAARVMRQYEKKGIFTVKQLSSVSDKPAAFRGSHSSNFCFRVRQTLIGLKLASASGHRSCLTDGQQHRREGG